MCGGYTTPDGWQDLRIGAGADWLPLSRRYNLKPFDTITIVRATAAAGRHAAAVQWWLVPFWSKDGTMAHPTFNARQEGLFDKPSFRAPARRRRCLIPADGFFERPEHGGPKRPRYYVRFRDRRPFCFAGVWDCWQGDDGRVLESAALITTRQNALTRALDHPRMPCILPREAWDLWLDPETDDPEVLQPLLADPWPAADLDAVPVRNSGIRKAESDESVFVAPLGLPIHA